jgi:hypothetical protein
MCLVPVVSIGEEEKLCAVSEMHQDWMNNWKNDKSALRGLRRTQQVKQTEQVGARFLLSTLRGKILLSLLGGPNNRWGRFIGLYDWTTATSTNP